MTPIDKTFVKKSFNSSASTYDGHAQLQKIMAEKLLEFSGDNNPSVSSILDVGMGTGNLTANLSEKFPGARIYGCDLAQNMIVEANKKLSSQGIKYFFSCADAELLSYKTNSFDMVFSSFTYQWLEKWDQAFGEVARVLKPGGCFAFSAFGSNTFTELKQSFKKACLNTGYRQGMAFELPLTEGKVRQIIESCGFKSHCIQSQSIVKKYRSVNDLIRAIKGMGARNASENRNRSFGIKKVWKKMIEIYEHDFKSQGKIPATFEIIMCKGENGKSRG